MPTISQRINRSNRAPSAQRSRSRRGQGTLEFVLLIVVFVSLVLALTAQFFKPFKKYADYYLGEYVQCLLDEGELPILGSENSTVDCGTPPSDFATAAGRLLRRLAKMVRIRKIPPQVTLGVATRAAETAEEV